MDLTATVIHTIRGVLCGICCEFFKQNVCNDETWLHEKPCIERLVQKCSISIANAVEILQSCTKASVCSASMWSSLDTVWSCDNTVNVINAIFCVVRKQWYSYYVPLYPDLVRDHSVYVPSHWDIWLHCNAFSHWLGTYTEWHLLLLYHVKLQWNCGQSFKKNMTENICILSKCPWNVTLRNLVALSWNIFRSVAPFTNMV